MNHIRRAGLVCLALVTLTACYGGTAATVAPTSVGAPVRALDSGLPLDPSIEPVSLSALDPGASSALDACSITDTTGQFGSNGPLGTKIVSGMGLIPSATDVGKYVPMTGLEPELKSPSPAWVIAVGGRLWLPFWPHDLNDPTCVVIGGGVFWWDTGGHFEGDTVVASPAGVDGRHVFRVPPLEP
jgi:hypothetical protein